MNESKDNHVYVILAIDVLLLWKGKESVGLRWSKRVEKEPHFEERNINSEGNDILRFEVLLFIYVGWCCDAFVLNLILRLFVLGSRYGGTMIVFICSLPLYNIGPVW